MTDVREGTVFSEDFWISCYRQNEPSVHGKVRAELDGKDRHFVSLKGRDGVEIKRGEQVRCGSTIRPPLVLKDKLFLSPLKRSYLVSCPQLGITETRVTVPTRTYTPSNTNSNPRIVCIPNHANASTFRLLCRTASQNNCFRCIPRRVTNCHRVRRRDSDSRIHVRTHKEISKRDPKGPRSLCDLTAVLPVLAGASDRRSRFHTAYPAS